ncbi:MAG TPA: class I SAM-dependent rRNA methyltransferase [Dongiaceae bacterium]|jgi:23S rRNA (cytosine1962-C5)-methyltransferase|nr:class I SAM-dependent rRNA methyltransferase [Dongiaceae bacterium]
MRSITLRPEAHRRLLFGHPWVYSNEIVMDAAAKTLPPGGVVRLLRADGEPLALAFFNPHPLIAARVLTRRVDQAIDAGFLAARLTRALGLRERLYDRPFYRLVHAEADGFPGTVVDRFGGLLVVQVNSAGMELLLPALLEAIDRVLSPDTVLLRCDSSTRALEGLAPYVKLAKGHLEGLVELEENGLRFLADPAGGQKTGWFFDQRDNRAVVARLSAGLSLLDLYSYAGGFALAAASAGAREITAVDRSEPALNLAEKAAAMNGFQDRCRFRRAEAFEELERLGAQGTRFGVVVADPPAFVKSKKELKQGARGYRKLARLAAAVVEQSGFLFIASCSHNMPVEEFERQVARGLVDAGREGRILRAAGAAPDHPVHPALPESAYLKSLLLQLD